LNTVNPDYLFRISQIQIVFQATIMGIGEASPAP
jgi:hypothetical protein